MLMLLVSGSSAFSQTPKEWKTLKGDINLFVASDLGRNGYYDQKPIAELMGTMAETIGPEAVIAAGDVHHFNGVASVNDPLWMTNFEQIYSHPELMIDWQPILGNHEYRGNTQAVMDYSQISRRWMSGERYYSLLYQDTKADVSLRVVMLDTTPLIDKYCTDTIGYPDACRQDANQQLAWLDSTLTAAKERWVIVVGHHPIFAQTTKSPHEREALQQKLLPVLRRHPNVAMYVCGHIHNFQHLVSSSDSIQYVVNSSASLSRKVKPTDGTKFCSSEAGYSVISATKQFLNLYMIDKTGTVIYTVSCQ